MLLGDPLDHRGIHQVNTLTRKTQNRATNRDPTRMLLIQGKTFLQNERFTIFSSKHMLTVEKLNDFGNPTTANLPSEDNCC